MPRPMASRAAGWRAPMAWHRRSRPPLPAAGSISSPCRSIIRRTCGSWSTSCAPTRPRTEGNHDRGRSGFRPDPDRPVPQRSNSQIELKHFVFKPAAEQYGFILRLAYGTLEYISGLTEKLAPDAMSIEVERVPLEERSIRLSPRDPAIGWWYS